MTIQEQQRAAREFAERWHGRGYEKGESKLFWCELLTQVFGVTVPSEVISFESQVRLDHTSFIDGFIDATKVMIEQKSLGKDLRAPIKQSDGSLLSPFQQAKRYAAELPYSKRPRWIVTCNFSDFLVYDMEQPNGEPYHIALADLEKEYYRLSFLTDTGKEHLRRELEVSKKAGEIIGVIYDKLLERYTTSPNPSQGGGFYAAEGVNSKGTPSLGGGRGEVLHSLNMLCVRLVFCLYAEDAGVFNHKQQFGDYLKQFAPKDLRRALLDLFKILDTPIEERDRFLEPELAAFPYVNGGLFSVEDRNIPQFTEELKDLLCRKASDDFNWSEISPTIFGAIFESTLNPETRRSGGMHYTSIENIHKVIDPLFLNELEAEFEAIQGEAVSNRLPQKAIENRFSLLHEKIAGLRFLDPACGSGNFLTETYISLRRLENNILKALNKGQSQLGFDKEYSPVKVSISQFYGIEINDFACTVARTALWIAEHQMLRETQAIIAHDLDFLPLKSYNNIIEGNALTIKWEDLPLTPSQGGGIPTFTPNPSSQERGELPSLGGVGGGFSYIMGNPPFVGASMMSAEQKAEAVAIYGKIKLSNSIDYVGAWYFKAAELMQGTKTKAALVSTNSITQGEQVTPLWQTLKERYGVQIDFAYRTFRWDCESNAKAHVHCVIIGFSCQGEAICNRLPQDNAANQAVENRFSLFDESGTPHQVKHIHPYLIDAPDIFIESRGTPICDVPRATMGNKPSDGSNLILTPEEKDEILRKYPELQRFIHLYLGAEEVINKKERYCFWLVDATPSDLKHPEIYARISRVKAMRENSTAKATREKALTPHLFFSIVQPKENYIIIPRVSSERRRYVPMCIMPPEVIASDACSITNRASLYEFGVLMSNVHMAWMRTVGGRLKSDYRYSGNVVYNTFPWPDLASLREIKNKIEQTAQGILDARAKYPNESLATLYDEVTMPIELRRAHRENDKAVMQAYGFDLGITESECVAKLMEMYKELTK